MKKLVSIMLALMMLISVAYTVSADASKAYGAEDLTYEILKDADGNPTGNAAVTGYSDSTIKATKYEDSTKEHSLTIPAKVTLDSDGNYSADGTEYTVTQINSWAFGGTGSSANRDIYLVSLELPYTVTDILQDAFAYCAKLKSVTVALEDGTKSTDTLLPPALKNLARGAFRCCDILSTSIVVPGTLRKVDDGAFYNDNQIGHITINEGVKIIRPDSFYNAMSANVTDPTIVIPKSIEEYYASAFTGSRIQSIVFSHDEGTTIKTIGKPGTNRNVNVWKGDVNGAGGCLGGFYQKQDYTKFYSKSAQLLKDLQTAYGAAMSTDTYAEKGMSYKQYYLSNNFILADSPDNAAFTVGDYNYKNAKMTWSETEGEDVPAFTAELTGFSNTEDKTAKEFDASNLVLVQGETSYRFEIDSVSQQAFKKTNWLKTFKATDSLKKIGDEAFYNCNLEDVYLGKTITSVGNFAFSLASIGYLIVPGTVQNFSLTGECRKLRYLIYDGSTLPDSFVPTGAIGGQLYGDCYVCVRAEALSTYNTAKGTSYKDGDILKVSALNKDGETANIVLKVLGDKPVADYLSRGETYRKAFVYNPSESAVSAAYAVADFGSDLSTYKSCYFGGNITVGAGSVWTADTAADGFKPAVDGKTQVKVMLFDSIETITPLVDVREVKAW